jgi:hypothetical protein
MAITLSTQALIASMVVLSAADPGSVLGRAGEAGTGVPMSAHCADREYRRLDYWVGDWDVYDVGDRAKAVARARVEVIAGGCALREVYEQTDGLVGQSLTIYDAARKVWHQSWVTNRGQLLTIEGRFDGDRLTLEGPVRSAEGRESTVRGVWVPDGEAVRETAHTSDDGGATWRLLFDVVFRRHTTGAAMSDTPDWERTATETLTRLNHEYVDVGHHTWKSHFQRATWTTQGRHRQAYRYSCAASCRSTVAGGPDGVLDKHRCEVLAVIPHKNEQ